MASFVGGPWIPKSGNLSKIKCSAHWGPKYVHIGAEGLWCAFWGFHQLPSLDIVRCLFLQVVPHFQYFLLYVINRYLQLLCSFYFCMFRQLVDDSLTRMAEACPLIEYLILSSCLSIGIDGLSSLHCLHKLTLLDLSYTFLVNLKPVFDSCLQLKVSLTVFLLGTLMLQILEYGTLRWNLVLAVVILCKYIMQHNCIMFIHMYMYAMLLNVLV
jgi:hypothetical protein